jgi:hypothetical protein
MKRKLKNKKNTLGLLAQGREVPKDFGCSYFFDENNTDKLLRILADRQKDPMEELKHRFSGRSGCNNLRSFCEQHNIQYLFDRWTE